MVNIYFSYQHFYLLIGLISAVIILYIFSLKTNKKRVLLFGNYATIKKVLGKNPIQKKYLLVFLRLVALILIILGLSKFTIVMVKGTANTDMAILLDTSSSMLTSDFTPNRLEAAKTLGVDLLDKLPEQTKIGVITFSGKAYQKLGLTNDKDEIKQTIKIIGPETPAGTAITDALSMGGSLLSQAEKKKMMILITDGRNNVGLPINTTFEYLSRNNITTQIIGMGKNKTSATEYNATGHNLSIPENATKASFPNLDVKMLSRLANITNGDFSLASKKKDLENAFDDIVVEKNEEKIDLTFYLIFSGLSILLIEWGLSLTKYETIP